MTTLNSLKNNLIDHILASENESLLKAINDIFNSTEEDKVVTLSPEQTEILSMSEQDIECDRLVSAEELDKSDKKWLK